VAVHVEDVVRADRRRPGQAERLRQEPFIRRKHEAEGDAGTCRAVQLHEDEVLAPGEDLGSPGWNGLPADAAGDIIRVLPMAVAGVHRR
jgi:hypothetical protein